ncbi:MAG TPA: hypothetical protein VK599_01820 [Streptosporangiaceae bacterium]|nr:hypothetical protein [Streptosporangiaceae bacterium]
MSEYDEAAEAFRRKWGFDPAPDIASALRRGEYDLEGGTEDERAFIREVLGDGRGGLTLFPAGDCAHCGLPIEESHLFEFAYGGGQRPVTVLVHTGSGHERCEGRETLAERSGQ